MGDTVTADIRFTETRSPALPNLLGERETLLGERGTVSGTRETRSKVHAFADDWIELTYQGKRKRIPVSDIASLTIRFSPHRD